MRSQTAISLLLAAVGIPAAAAQSSTASALPKASAVTNNPAGTVYKATLPDEAFFKSAYPEGGNVKGEITAATSPDQSGVIFKVNFSNLPKSGGPFTYHLHVAPVPENGNCTATLAHLDPTARGEEPPCDPANPETCQVGDLSGKYGKIPEGKDTFSATYTDKYASTLEGIGAFFGNRSFVFHYANKTRISCANFALVASSGSPTESACEEPGPASTASGSPSMTANGTIPHSSAPTSVQTTAPSQTSAIPAAGSNIKAGWATALVLAAAIMFVL
ncbi:superoxide dismutase [Rhypophila sp. PSN 637]